MVQQLVIPMLIVLLGGIRKHQGIPVTTAGAFRSQADFVVGRKFDGHPDTGRQSCRNQRLSFTPAVGARPAIDDCQPGTSDPSPKG